MAKMQSYPDFRKQCMRVLASKGPCKGLAVKAELNDYYGEDVNHGRLYPNLDKLVQAGLVEKGQIDKRTNSYELTEQGMKAVKAEAEAWSKVSENTGKSDGGGK